MQKSSKNLMSHLRPPYTYEDGTHSHKIEVVGKYLRKVSFSEIVGLGDFESFKVAVWLTPITLQGSAKPLVATQFMLLGVND